MRSRIAAVVLVLVFGAVAGLTFVLPRWLGPASPGAAALSQSATDLTTKVQKLRAELDVAEANTAKANGEKAAADKDLETKKAAAKSAADEEADAIANSKKLRSEGSPQAPDAINRETSAIAKAKTAKEDLDAAAKSAAERAEDFDTANRDLLAAKGKFDDAVRTATLQFGAWHWSAVWMALLLAGFFPVSAIAFSLLEVPSIIKQLRNDCKLLGKEDYYQHYEWRWDWGNYVIQGTLAVVAAVVGVSLFFRPSDGLIGWQTLRAMQYGFLGAYVFCLNLVYRRYTTLDLQPHVYLYCASTLIAGMVINFVAFEAITSVTAVAAGAQPEGTATTTSVDVASGSATVGSNAVENRNASAVRPDAEKSEGGLSGLGAGAAAILAFSLGYFPNLAIRWFSRVSRRAVGERQRRSDALPLSLIDGISELHEARLQDEGIDNVQNLATTSIPDLVAKTPFTAQQIVEWTDQAVLYLYLDPGEIDSFRRSGLRSVTDFCDNWTGSRSRTERRRALALQLATTEERLDNLFQAIQEGPNMDYVRRYWMSVRTEAAEIRERLVNQVCGRVGRAIRDSQREGEDLSAAEILNQVANEMFGAAAAAGSEDITEITDITAESMIGQAYLQVQLGRFAEARQKYTECIDKFPDDAVAYNDLAWLDLQQLSQRSAHVLSCERATKAVGIAKKAVPPLTELASYLDTLAMAHIRLGEPDEGFKKSQEAIQSVEGQPRRRRDPRLLETVVIAGEAFLALGDGASARQVVKYLSVRNYANEKTKKRLEELKAHLASSDKGAGDANGPNGKGGDGNDGNRNGSDGNGGPGRGGTVLPAQGGAIKFVDGPTTATPGTATTVGTDPTATDAANQSNSTPENSDDAKKPQ